MSSGAGSEQVVGTPRDFLDAVEARFGALEFDLAATADNSVCGCAHYGPGSSLAKDSLAERWDVLIGNLWLNPEYNDIGPWVRKASETTTGRDRRIHVLVPLTTAAWARDYVWGKARVFGLAPRLKFTGHSASFPRDLMLAVYGEPVGFEIWNWRLT